MLRFFQAFSILDRNALQSAVVWYEYFFICFFVYLCVYYSSIFGNVTRMKWHKSPKECDHLLTLPFTLINPIIITYHGNRGTCFYRGCIPHTFPFRLSLLLTIRIKPLSLDNKHDHSACFLNRGCRSIFNLRFLSCTYACSSIFGNVTRMKWHNSSKGTSHSFEAWQICF